MRIARLCHTKGCHTPKFRREIFCEQPQNRKIREGFLPRKFPAIQYTHSEHKDNTRETLLLVYQTRLFLTLWKVRTRYVDYRIVGNFRGRKLSQISRFCGYSRKFSLQNLIFLALQLVATARKHSAKVFHQYAKVFHQFVKVFSLESSHYIQLCFSVFISWDNFQFHTHKNS